MSRRVASELLPPETRRELLLPVIDELTAIIEGGPALGINVITKFYPGWTKKDFEALVKILQAKIQEWTRG